MKLITTILLVFLLEESVAYGVHWQHPAGLVTEATLAELQSKLRSCEWARKTYEGRKVYLDRWRDLPAEELARVFPKKRGNVYHNFSCPTDRRRLEFDPFRPDHFKCSICGKEYAPETNAQIYTTAERYYGTMYDGWACLFYEDACTVAADLGLVSKIEKDPSYAEAGVRILMLYADTIERLPTKADPDPQMRVILTYHREGDSIVLYDLARAYELLRDAMSPAQRERYERVVLRRMLDDIMLEPFYRYEHNNLYQWHRTIIQTGLALEREDLIDWSFGYGKADPEHLPEHRNIRRLLASHFKPDGAYWEMCSGYHLYPLHFLCELAVVSQHLAAMDPQRFPAERYDLTERNSPGGKTIHNALHWFPSMAMPDGSMTTIGDSMAARAGMNDYHVTAEVGYRFFGVQAIGRYRDLVAGKRSWSALLYGAPEIAPDERPATSSHLSSGWVSLRNRWGGNDVWIGLNALIPGGGHQHADRLGLVTWSHGQLLALEKSTPYNEHVTHDLARSTPMHNTITVDGGSQPPGSSLTAAQTPRVMQFHAGPVAAFAMLAADRIYPQTQVHHRKVALIEDVIVDAFEVRGGKTHDWMLHHAGAAPRISTTMEGAVFTPAAWLANGSPRARRAATDAAWEARWRVADVTSRLTMAGAPGTEVFALETYPVDNAVVTPQNPPCQSLCVRRHSDAPFVAVWDAWKGAPNLRSVAAGTSGNGLRITTVANTYWMLLAPGEARFDDGFALASDGEFALLRNRDAVLLVGAMRLEVTADSKRLRVTLPEPATVSIQRKGGRTEIETWPAVQYDTYGGENHLRDRPKLAVAIEGDLWPTTAPAAGSSPDR